MNTYDINDVARLSSAFTADGTATDPTTITLTVRTPAGVEASYTYALAELTKSSAGVFYRDQDCTESGTWYYRFTGTGAVKAAGEAAFVVRRSQFTT